MASEKLEDKFDLVVIGSGPAGYVAAIRAAQLGMKTACIEKGKTYGGTCLNVGCIPSKALLDSSEQFHHAKTKLQKHGVVVGEVQLDLAQMMKRKDAVVRQLVNGVAGLFKKNKIEGITGTAKLMPGPGPARLIEIDNDGKKRTVSATRVLLATGSVPTQLPFLPFDGKNILSSTEALEITAVPKHLVVIGGGVIGLELGSVWLRLGAKVTVVEFQDRICSIVDKQIGAELQKSLTKQGMEFKLSTKCTGASQNGKGMTVHLEELQSGTKIQLECDKILVSTGRRPYSEGLGLDAVGLKTDKLGVLPVDAHYQTSVPGIYAVGDLIAGPMLAHKAEEEGIAAVELMAGQAGHVNYMAIPNVIYTWPELASVGQTEEELKAKGIEYKSGTFPFMANGRAKAMEESEGMVKILSDKKTDRLLGMHIVGPWASDLIAEGVTVMEFGGSAEDIARTCHAHPTLSEVVKEAALAVDKRQINM
ncbi:MAG: dihydrolipoyl dehydrogenase [Bdellovibrionia bacterium]